MSVKSLTQALIKLQNMGKNESKEEGSDYRTAGVDFPLFPGVTSSFELCRALSKRMPYASHPEHTQS